MIGGTYIIKNIQTEGIYVGSAKDFDSRWKTHLKALRRNSHINIYLQRSFNKHGEQAFIFTPVEALGSYNKEFYFQKENELMDLLRADGKTLYNIAKAQGGWSFHDDETKKQIAIKISKGVRNTTALMSVDERKQKFTRWTKDNPLPESARAKISTKMNGIIRSAETRSKMKAAQMLLADSKREMMRSVGKMNKGRLPPNTRAVMLNDGTIHESLKKAAEYLSMSSSWLLKKMKQNELGKYIDSPSKKEEN